jgi:hypothetical protein
LWYWCFSEYSLLAVILSRPLHEGIANFCGEERVQPKEVAVYRVLVTEEPFGSLYDSGFGSVMNKPCPLIE